MKRRHLLPFLAVSAFLTSQSFAVAPSDQYAPFLRDSDEIVDLKTHLAWYRLQLGQEETSLAAELACAKVRDAGPSYRLATLKEALSIVDAQSHAAYVISSKRTETLFVDPGAFGQLAPADYWTISKFQDRPYYVDLRTGFTSVTSVGDKARRYPLCVRSVP